MQITHLILAISLFGYSFALWAQEAEPQRDNAKATPIDVYGY